MKKLYKYMKNVSDNLRFKSKQYAAAVKEH